MSNIIVYLAVDKDGTETMYDDKPKRQNDFWGFYLYNVEINLPRGTIKKLTGKDITWDNDYIEYVGDNYDPTID